MRRAGLNERKLCLQAGVGRGEWLFHSNELQRSHAQPEPCNLPRSVLTNR